MKRFISLLAIGLIILPSALLAASNKEGGTGKPEEDPAHTKPNPQYTLLVDTSYRTFAADNQQIAVEKGDSVVYRLIIDNQGDGDFRNIRVQVDIADNVDYYLESTRLNRNIDNNLSFNLLSDGRSDKRDGDSATYSFNFNNETMTVELGTIKAGEKGYVELGIFVPLNGQIGSKDMTFQISGTEVATKKIGHTISTENRSTPSNTSYYLIVDFSYSMNENPGGGGKTSGSRKIDIAKTALESTLSSLTSNEFALRVYGSKNISDSRQSCKDHYNALTFGQHSSASVSDTLDGLGANGYTPIAATLEGARVYLNSQSQGEKQNTLYHFILISDGAESCGGDPTKAVMDLVSSDLNIKIDTIGFDIDAKGSAELRAVADIGGGQYLSAG